MLCARIVLELLVFSEAGTVDLTPLAVLIR